MTRAAILAAIPLAACAVTTGAPPQFSLSYAGDYAALAECTHASGALGGAGTRFTAYPSLGYSQAVSQQGFEDRIVTFRRAADGGTLVEISSPGLVELQKDRIKTVIDACAAQLTGG